MRSGGGLHLGSEKTKEALLELKAVLENNPKVVAHYPVEVRFARGDDILLSPCFQRDSCYMNIIMYRPYGKDVPRLDYWLAYKSVMKKAGGRPHWAKVPLQPGPWAQGGIRAQVSEPSPCSLTL
ncbi:L-gulonolactone oxidase-like [Chrysemys picta bellii]|uniref:L-gulonolactone oxidase-like n=1 Tax=Chrysemys picta bellii TaxID=8478 RepID=UPI0032B29038